MSPWSKSAIVEVNLPSIKPLKYHRPFSCCSRQISIDLSLLEIAVVTGNRVACTSTSAPLSSLSSVTSRFSVARYPRRCLYSNASLGGNTPCASALSRKKKKKKKKKKKGGPEKHPQLSSDPGPLAQEKLPYVKGLNFGRTCHRHPNISRLPGIGPSTTVPLGTCCGGCVMTIVCRETMSALGDCVNWAVS